MESWNVHLTEKIERAEGTMSFRFERPPGLDFKAGQYFFVYINVGDRLLVHHFSFSASPTEKDFIELTTRLRDSEFKQTLNALPIGSKVEVKEIHGEFTLDGVKGKVAFIAGGIGITAARSNIRWALDSGAENDILLLYANKNLASSAFKLELDELAEKHGTLRVVHILSRPEPGWRGPTGHVSAEVIRQSVPDWRERLFYISGPPAMVATIKKVLVEEMDLPNTRIKEESFLGY